MSDHSDLYRPNAAAIYQRPNGDILICERSVPRGCWQFPQGGMKLGEEALLAAMREGMEETGFRPNEYEVEGTFGPYRYDYPEVERERVFKKRGIPYAGQEQFYFVFRMHDDVAEPWLDEREFCAYRWVKPADFDRSSLPEFKRGVYEQVFTDVFGL